MNLTRNQIVYNEEYRNEKQENKEDIRTNEFEYENKKYKKDIRTSRA